MKSDENRDGISGDENDTRPTVETMAQYSVDRDLHEERDIARYVESQAPGEIVKFAEIAKTEYVSGHKYTAWNVITNESRWWIITNMTNLYLQDDFPSLDFTLSFHIGLVHRVASRTSDATADDPSPFDEVFRRQRQAKDFFDRAVQPEDYQSVAVQLREMLLALNSALRRRIELPTTQDRPHDSDFVGWSNLLVSALSEEASLKRLRKYLRGFAKDLWELTNWLVHDQKADPAAHAIAIESCDTMVGHVAELERKRNALPVLSCPVCRSRDVHVHFDHSIGADGDYYTRCASCGWTDHRSENTEPESTN